MRSLVISNLKNEFAYDLSMCIEVKDYITTSMESHFALRYIRNANILVCILPTRKVLLGFPTHPRRRATIR